MFSKKATKIDKIFNADLILCSKCQIDSEDFVNFCGLLRKHELYLSPETMLALLTPGTVGNQFFEMDGCFWYVTVVTIPSLTGPSVLGA